MRPFHALTLTLALWLSSLLSGIAQNANRAVVTRVEGKRDAQVLPFKAQGVDHVFRYIDSCKSSTPLTGGAGAGPLSSIVEFRDLIATRPSVCVHLAKVRKVEDKSGVKGESPLELTELMVIDLSPKSPRVFAYTQIGLLVEFWHGDKEALASVAALFAEEAKETSAKVKARDE